MEDNSFAWTFPVYVLATYINRNRDGIVILDEQIRFAAIEEPLESLSLAVFTDLDQAETFRESHHLRDQLEPLELSRELLVVLLRRASASFAYLVVDPYQKTRRGWRMEFGSTIAELERHATD